MKVSEPMDTCKAEGANAVYEIVVFGAPMGKERPRATSFGGHARIYTPKKTQSYEARFSSEWNTKYPSQEPLTEALIVDIWCYFPLLKSDYKKDGSFTKSGTRKLDGVEKPTKKPDADNIAKAVLDGLNGIAFVDDSQVTSLSVHKRYSYKPRVKVTISSDK